MRVNPEVSALLESPVDAERTDAFFASVTGYPVHDAVGAVVEPCAFGDIPVGRLDIRPLDEEKSPDYNAILIDADITVAVPDIIPDQIFRRPLCWTPLIRVAVLRHVPSRKAVNLHHSGKVMLGCMPDYHGIAASLSLKCLGTGFSVKKKIK